MHVCYVAMRKYAELKFETTPVWLGTAALDFWQIIEIDL